MKPDAGLQALTLTEPWARLWGFGKVLETRSWPPPRACWGQPLAIHAAKGYAGYTRQELDDLCRTWPFNEALAALGYAAFGELPFGAVVAVGTLVSGRPILDYDIPREYGHLVTSCPRGREMERALGYYAPGRWAWQLADVQALATPIPARGYQGLWRWAPPADLGALYG